MQSLEECRFSLQRKYPNISHIICNTSDIIKDSHCITLPLELPLWPLGFRVKETGNLVVILPTKRLHRQNNDVYPYGEDSLPREAAYIGHLIGSPLSSEQFGLETLYSDLCLFMLHFLYCRECCHQIIDVTESTESAYFYQLAS